jgi:hypothetical protein
MKRLLTLFLLLWACGLRAQTPAVPEIPALAAYHALLPALEAALAAGDTNAVLTACLDMTEENRDLRQALLDLSDRLPAYGATNILPGVETREAIARIDALVFEINSANRIRSELQFAALEWQGEPLPEVLALATNALENIRVADSNLTPRVAVVLTNLVGLTADPWLAGAIQSESEALPGDLLGVRVVLRNVGDAALRGVTLECETTSNLGIDPFRVRLGDIPAHGRKSHLLIVEVPAGFDNAGFRVRATPANAPPLFLQRTLLIGTP